ncbi:MAG: hypothetical protein J1F05_01550 [Muribaculaceae bacterium]|nr:hypothetical protein [Muribaculaceae bacterium]
MKIKSLERRKPKPPKYLPVATSYPNPQTKLFLLLLMLGYSQSEAYRIAINPNIKANSASVSACNLLKDPNTQRIAKSLVEAYINGEWLINTNILRDDVIEI